MADGNNGRQTALYFSIGAVVIALGGAYLFQSMHVDAPIVPGPGWVKTMLSDTMPSLKGSDGDTPVFTFDSGKPGGTFIILGGTHPQEIAGLLAADLMVENATITQGKLIVIPEANHSGFTFTDPMEAYTHDISLPAKDGSTRWFPIGMRRSNPADQWPDPDMYIHVPSGEPMIGEESRNLNRNHPGLATGTMTAQVSYALTQLVKTSNMVLDLHEAQPEYPVINKIVYHQRAISIAGEAVAFGLPADGIPITGDPSAQNLHGLSHREFGDFTQSLALLAETADPAMGRFRGRLSMDLVVGGKEPNYVAAAKLGPKGLLFVPFDDNGWPLQARVGRHVATIMEIINAYNDNNSKNQIKVTGIPDFNKIIKNDLKTGLGQYLNPAPAGSPSAPPFA